MLSSTTRVIGRPSAIASFALVENITSQELPEQSDGMRNVLRVGMTRLTKRPRSLVHCSTRSVGESSGSVSGSSSGRSSSSVSVSSRSRSRSSGSGSVKRQQASKCEDGGLGGPQKYSNCTVPDFWTPGARQLACYCRDNGEEERQRERKRKKEGELSWGQEPGLKSRARQKRKG